MDLVMQIGTQPHTHRVWKYFQERHQWHDVFPEDFADSAEEVGPFTDQGGPCLVLFRNMHLTPKQLDKWLDKCFVGRVCMRVFWLDNSIPAAANRQELIQGVLSSDAPAGLTSVRLDIYPKSIAMDLARQILSAGYSYPMHPVSYSHVLYVVQLAPDCLRWSYMAQGQAWKMPSTAPARFDKSVATAINKLAEAMQVLGLKNSSLQQQLPQPLPAGASLGRQQQQQQHSQQDGAIAHMPPLVVAAAAAPNAHHQRRQQQQQQQPPQLVRWAVDVGACPGGWTSYLADCCGYHVLAIDPAPLHPDVTARPRVVQILGRAQEVEQQVDAVLDGQLVDLLVCDMNAHPVVVGEYLQPLLPKLRPGGWLILTLKFYGKGREKLGIGATLDEQYFKGQLQPGRVTWLLANTLCERTYLARKMEA